MANEGLKGKKVLLTRPVEGSEEFKRKLDFKGAEVISSPMIRLELKEDQSLLNKAFDQLEEYDWVIFNSPAAVRFFFQRVEDLKLKMYFYPDLKFATVGEKTKMTLEQLGYRTNFVPIEYTAEVLAENIYDVEGRKVLIPASELTSGNYVEVFEKRGARPELITFYENKEIILEEEEKEALRSIDIDYITFTSGSTVKGFFNNFGNPKAVFKNAQVVSIGPSTAKVADELGIQIDIIANPYTIEGMIEAMISREKEMIKTSV